MSRARVFGSAAVLLLTAAPVRAQGDDVRVIVGFKTEIDEVTLEELGAPPGGTLTSTRAISAMLPASMVSRLRSNPRITTVEQNSIVEASLTGGDDSGDDWSSLQEAPGGGGGGKPPKDPPPDPEVEPWGVTRVGGPRSAAGIKIGIISTGIDLDHPDLAANIMGDVNIINPNKSGDDDHGAGTRWAGIAAAIDNEIGIIGVAHDASLYAIKVFGKKGGGSLFNLASGIDWARDNGMNIVLIAYDDHRNFDYLEIACDAAEAAGVLLFARAGHSGGEEFRYPASYDSVVSVTATDMDNVVTPQSNTNSQVELSGPGVDILTTEKGGGYTTLNVGNQFGGTRPAAVHAVGVAAVIWKSQGAGATNATVRQSLQDNAEDLGDPGRDNSYGYGLVKHLQ